MIDLKRSKDKETTIELDLADRIKDSLQEGMSFQFLLTVLFKILLISIGPGVLKFIEVNNIRKIETNLQQLKAEFKSKEDQIQQIIKKIESYDTSKIKKVDFDNKFSILTQLAQERLQVIKVLDNLQSSVDSISESENTPDEFMFFDSINVSNNKVVINAVANNEEVVKNFLSQLESEKPRLYSSVHLNRISSTRGALKKFLVNGILAKEEVQ